MVNFVAMKHAFVIIAVVFMLVSCGGDKPRKERFTIERMNKITPVKNQGQSPLCWVYAMLATIESDRLMQGDSVNLSAAYVARSVLMRQAEQCYLTRGSKQPSLRGVAPMALDALFAYGVMPFDAYCSDADFHVAARRIRILAENAAVRRTGVTRLRDKASDMLDDAVNPVPHRVYMLGAEYTPLEFAHSVCREGEYVAMTSFTHKPFDEMVELDLPDNTAGCRFMNVPVDTLIAKMVVALGSGRSVCWEGDVSEPHFSFADGTARLENESDSVTQEQRQRAFETFRTTDDHCMAVVGLARDDSGNRYFVCKNSWGTGNPYGGLMFMSFNYARMKTVAVVMKKD